MRETTGTLAGPRRQSLRLSRTTTTAFGLAVLWSWSLWISAAHDFGMADESWFLQVLSRIVGGDAPYRDVFWGTTPLSLYLTAPLVALFGVEIMVVKAVVAACLALSVGLTLRIGRQLGIERHGLMLLGLALLAYCWPRPSAAYTPLANLCLLACASAALSWRAAVVERRRGAAGTLAWAGCWAGCAFAAKQNFGLVALALLGGIVVVTWIECRAPFRRVGSALMASATACGLVLAATILPIVLWDGWEQFVDYGFSNKTTYVDVGRLPYRFELRELPRDLREMRSISDLLRNYGRAMFLVPPLVGLLLLLSLIVARGRRGTVLILLGLLVAGLLTSYPRFDTEHLVFGMPLVLLGLVWSGSVLASRLPRRFAVVVATGLVLWWGIGLVLIGGSALYRNISPQYEPSTLPHFRGVVVARDELRMLERYAAQLRAATTEQQPFLLTPYAGFFYLVTGLDNPTPFDYPLVTAFGRTGRADVMAAIDAGRIERVCMQTFRNYIMSPTDLERFVVANMTRGRRFDFCTMYRR